MRFPRLTQWTRRAWLASLAAVSAARADTYSGEIIDTHVHFYDPTRPQGVPWPSAKETQLYKRTLPSDFREATRDLGVTGVIVVEASAWVEDNQWVLDLAKDDPLIVAVVGHIDPGTPDFAGHLERFSKNPLFRGIRINGNGVRKAIADASYRSDIERLAAAGLQLDVFGDHTMFEPLLRLTERLPGMPVVIDHLPFDGPVGASLRELGQRASVYAKISGVLRNDGTEEQYRGSLDTMWATFGRDRLIYGSNWPVSNRMGTYPRVLQVVKDYFAAKGQDAAQRYFVKNAATAYRWPTG